MSVTLLIGRTDATTQSIQHGTVWNPGQHISVLFTAWNQILPAAIETLPPLHQELVSYLLTLPGKRKMSYTHAKQTWNLDRQEFDAEMGNALAGIRQHLHRYGIRSADDLDLEQKSGPPTVSVWHQGCV